MSDYDRYRWGLRLIWWRYLLITSWPWRFMTWLRWRPMSIREWWCGRFTGHRMDPEPFGPPWSHRCEWCGWWQHHDPAWTEAMGYAWLAQQYPEKPA